jgi:predicted transcriptional regulator
MLNQYELSRNFWDFAFENTGKIKPVHVAIYFFAMEHCNRLGWKKNFGLPTSMVLEAISVKSYSVYKKAFDDLIEFGFFEIIQYSRNQYSSNIIALKENYKANDKANLKALDKALIKHGTKQGESTVQSIDSINKQRTRNKEQETIKPEWKNNFEIYKKELYEACAKLKDDKEWFEEREKYHHNLDITQTLNKAVLDYWATEEGWQNKKSKRANTINWKSTLTKALSSKLNQVWKKNNN